MQRAKQNHKSKEEVAKTLEQNAEVARKREIVTTKFYPALVAATVSIDEAKMLIQSINSLLFEEVLQTMKDRKFEEIVGNLLKKLCPNGDRETEVKALLSVFNGEDLFVSRELIEGMTNAIDHMLHKENQNRTLNSLIPDWDSMLNK